MRIAIFTETYLPDANGVATHIKTLKDGLEALGHTVLIVKSDASSKRHYIENGVMHCPGIKSKKLYNYNLSSPLSLERLIMLKKWNPDIIHIQNEFGIGFSGVMIARMLKKPLVYTLHTMYDDYIYYVAAKPFIPIVKKASHGYCKSLAKKASALTGASKKIEDYFRECGIKKPVNIIPNAVELDLFEEKNIDKNKISEIKSAYNITDDKTVFSFCGRLGKEKNIDTLFRFWSETVKKEDNLILLIMGAGPDSEELIELTKTLGIDDNVFFTGKIEHSNIPPYYVACDAYVTASLSENYSISMLEAMASGLPIIHLRDEKNESQTVEGVNGFVFDTAEQMYEVMMKIKKMSLQEKQDMKHTVRESVKQSGEKCIAQHIVDIYTDLYDKNRHDINLRRRHEKGIEISDR